MNPSALPMLPTLALGALLLLAAPVHAEPAAANDDDPINPDRPGIADGSNVVGAGRFQIEAGVQQEDRRDTGTRSRTLFIPVLLRLGLDRNLELRVEGNTYTWTRESGAGQGAARSAGLAPTSIGLKVHFVDAIGSRQPSPGAIVRAFPRSGSGGLRAAHATGDFRIAADWEISRQWSLNPNIGVALYEDDTQRLYRSALFAATLGYSPSGVLNVFIDAGLQYPERKQGRAGAIVDVGVAWLVRRDMQLDFSAGTRAAGTTAPRRFLSAGLGWRL